MPSIHSCCSEKSMENRNVPARTVAVSLLNSTGDMELSLTNCFLKKIHQQEF